MNIKQKILDHYKNNGDMWGTAVAVHGVSVMADTAYSELNPQGRSKRTLRSTREFVGAGVRETFNKSHQVSGRGFFRVVNMQNNQTFWAPITFGTSGSEWTFSSENEKDA